MIQNSHYKDIKIQCPTCGSTLNIYDHLYYNDNGDGEIDKESEIEWECLNGCTFDNATIANIDAQIESSLNTL